MGRKKIKDFSEVVKLFEGLGEGGSSILEISLKFGITKQAVSSRLRKYYKTQTPAVCRKMYLTEVCKVCSNRKELPTRSTPVANLKKLNLKPIREEIKTICSDCLENKVYKCTTCGTFGRMDSGIFLKKAISEKNQRAKCLKCNYNNHKKWRKNNKEKSREILRTYKKNVRDQRRLKGLCTDCGGKKQEKENALCLDCRERNKTRYNNRKLEEKRGNTCQIRHR